MPRQHTAIDSNLGEILPQPWPYSDSDPAALGEIGRRVAAVGRRQALIHYSDLVRGVTLRMATVGEGAPFELGVPEWRDLDRAIRGNLLLRLSLTSYQRGRCLASSLVTAKALTGPVTASGTLWPSLGC